MPSGKSPGLLLGLSEDILFVRGAKKATNVSHVRTPSMCITASAEMFS